MLKLSPSPSPTFQMAGSGLDMVVVMIPLCLYVIELGVLDFIEKNKVAMVDVAIDSNMFVL